MFPKDTSKQCSWFKDGPLFASPQEDLLDVIHWQRQLIAITCGLIWGILPLTGLYPFLG